jgi:hypothetical protein
LQQSVLTPHELPEPLHELTDDAHVLATGSHDCEQHSLFALHVAPVTVQVTPTPPVSPVPPLPVDAPEPPVPVVPTLAELLPQLGSTSIAPMSSAEMTMMDKVVGEGRRKSRVMMGRSINRAKRLTAPKIPFARRKGPGREPFHPLRVSALIEWACS